MTGMPPATAASKLRATPLFSASLASSVPWRASSALLAVTTGLPACERRLDRLLGRPFVAADQLDEHVDGWVGGQRARARRTIRAPRATRRASCCATRADTPATSIVRPRLCASRGPCSAKSCNSPLPTVPRPAIPNFNGLFMGAQASAFLRCDEAEEDSQEVRRVGPMPSAAWCLRCALSCPARHRSVIGPDRAVMQGLIARGPHKRSRGIRHADIPDGARPCRVAFTLLAVAATRVAAPAGHALIPGGDLYGRARLMRPGDFKAIRHELRRLHDAAG